MLKVAIIGRWCRRRGRKRDSSDRRKIVGVVFGNRNSSNRSSTGFLLFLINLYLFGWDIETCSRREDPSPEVGMEIEVMTTPVNVLTSCTCFDGPQQVEAAHVRSLAGQSKAQLSVSLALSSDGIFLEYILITTFIQRPLKSQYLGELGLNCCRVDAFIVEEFFYFLGDFHVIGKVTTTDMR